jgi:hypothetical protein
VIIPAAVNTLTPRSFRPGTAVEILEFEGGSQLRELTHDTFRNCSSLKSICIPSSVLAIESYCFCEFTVTRLPRVSALEAIIFESTSKLREIESHAFYGYWMLKSIRLPASLERIDGSGLCACGLTNIAIEDGNGHFAVRSPFFVDFQSIRIVRYFGETSEVFTPEEIETVGCQSFSDCHSLLSIEFSRNFTTFFA